MYKENPDNLTIKFEYAKALEKVDMELAKKLLKELRGTPNENYALQELGNIARNEKSYLLAMMYFTEVLNGSKFSLTDKNIAILEIGKLEAIMGNSDNARKYFDTLRGTSIECYALIEIGKLDLADKKVSLAKDSFLKCLGSKCDLHAKLWLGRIETIERNYMNALIYFNELSNSSYQNTAEREIARVRELQLRENPNSRKGKGGK